MERRIWVSISLLEMRIDWVGEGHGWLFINLGNCYWTPDALQKAARTAKKWMKLSLHAKNPFFLLQIQPQNKAAMLYP
jgi:hypothetical protein